MLILAIARVNSAKPQSPTGWWLPYPVQLVAVSNVWLKIKNGSTPSKNVD
jgi:hypothetical protein